MTGKGDEMLNEESMETIKPVPQRRIVDKMNEYMSRRDYAGAERHLLYWLLLAGGGGAGARPAGAADAQE